MKIGFYTLGCKVNQYETQAMEQLFRLRGHQIAPFESACDAYIINTCSVTAVSDKKNRAVIRRCRREHPDAVIGVCGCYSQHAPEAVEALDADVVSGSAGREAFVDMVEQAMSDRGKRCQIDQAMKRRDFEVLPAGGLVQRTRAMLKVQDGCVNFCSYCIIPYTRGPVRSAPVELAVRQAQQLAADGYQELVVTGIEIASWGADLPDKPPLTDLLTAVCEAVPHMRVRLGSLEPRIIDRDFCQTMSRYSNLCPQFHLSMQSGCDSVLQRMRRKYTTQRYYESVCLLREYFPECAVTTDMIVAFPGETQEEFDQSLAFIRRCGFADMHIFPYSRRPGTPADKMPGQLGNAVKEDRSRQAIAVAGEMNLTYRQSMVGNVYPVLFETEENSCFTGHAPNSIRIYAQGEDLQNQVLPVKILRVHEDGLWGELL